MSSHAMKHYSKYNFRLLYHWLAYSLATFSTIYHNHIHSADEDSKSAVKSCFLLFMILIAIFFFTSTMVDEVTLLNFWASMSVVNRTWATERVICFCRWIQFTRRFQFSSTRPQRKINQFVNPLLFFSTLIYDVWRDKAPLLPSNPHERAQSMFWADFIDKKVWT